MKRVLAVLAVLVSCGTPEEAADTAPDLPTDAVSKLATDAVPITGGTLAVSPDGRLAAASDITGDRVHLIDVASGAALGFVDLESGDRPARLLVDDDGLVFASLRRGKALAKLDPLDGTVLARTEACPSPRGLDRDGDTVWLACASGELQAFDAQTVERRSSWFVEHDLRDVVTTDGRLFVSRFKTAELLELDPASGIVLDRRVPTVFDNATIDLIDAPDFSYSPSVAWRTLVDDNGDVVMIHQRGSDSIIEPPPEAPPTNRVYYAPDPVVPDTPRRGCSGLAHSAMTRFGTDGSVTSSGILGAAHLPTDGALAPDGTIAVVAAAANDDLDGQLSADVVVFDEAVYDVLSNDCIFGDETVIEDDSQVSSVAFAGSTQITVGRSPFRVHLDGTEVALAHPDPVITGDEAAYRSNGFDLFHKDASLGMTCAGCHPEGLEDGRVWQFRELGPRRTQSMAGGLGDTAPFHWGAEFYSFSNLMTEVLVNRLGHDAIAPVDSESLRVWMHAIPTSPVTPEQPDRVTEGDVLFRSDETQCTFCHTTGLLTNNTTVDVGTGGAWQVPTLRGVGGRGPWMHDGCAETLQQRFDPACGGGDLHGKTSHLTPEQIDAMVAYLQTL